MAVRVSPYVIPPLLATMRGHVRERVTLGIATPESDSMLDTTACPTDDEIQALFESRLPEEQRVGVVVHVDSCSTCRELVSELARVVPASRASAPEMLRAGDRIGRYHILEEVGSGGMGTVYAAYDSSLDRRVALKLWRWPIVVDDGTDDQARRRLAREARALARVAHPNVVTLFDLVVEGPRQYLTMEFVEGTTLARWLDAEARPLAEILQHFLEAGRGLAAAHAAGIVHRDFKPANVLVSPAGQVKVSDFGLARGGTAMDDRGSVPKILTVADGPAHAHGPANADGPAHAHGPANAHGLANVSEGSVTHPVAGTPGYMPPEQLQGRASIRSDQFAFAVALFRAIHGKKPFEEGVQGPDYTKRVAPGLGRGVSTRLTDALARALSPKEADRFASMDPLLAAIEAELRPADAWRAGRRTAFAIGSILVAMSAGVPIFVLLRREELGLGASPMLHIAWMAVLFATLVAAVLFSDRARKTAHSRALVRGAFALILVQALATAGGMTLGLPFSEVQVFHFLIQFLVFYMATVFIETRWWPLAVLCLAAYGVACGWPEQRWVVGAITNVGILVGVVLAWYRESRRSHYEEAPTILEERLPPR